MSASSIMEALRAEEFPAGQLAERVGLRQVNCSYIFRSCAPSGLLAAGRLRIEDFGAYAFGNATEPAIE